MGLFGLIYVNYLLKKVKNYLVSSVSFERSPIMIYSIHTVKALQILVTYYT